jgi:5-(carboxyamino)imidazole ribonucleotide synthase
MDGAVTSQFENHVRAVLGLPLGDAAAKEPTTMVNLIGGIPPLDRLLELDGVHVHLYGKDARPGRKVGHVNLVGAGAETEQRVIALAEAASTT